VRVFRLENEIARLAQQPNFQAKVKLLSGEYTIQTKNVPQGLTGMQVAKRIAQIQAQTRTDYCKPRTEVEKEIRERHEGLRSSASDEPPPTHY
jgi:hypothetical protein